ncbi:hypothetical protein [Paraburkholderia phytofirmans]|uniref:Guanylate cyclase domain-containing protein n=2 Tax=Paraburkholderia phytofirmans TaxID=261302 RepID=B2T6E4_PARPJ|nr:hypothetical protein [Paraburkholderia phytofirmans]ACD17508.1 conserved hypothetical protein [Paraburkholderia phytofirmans PsJN]
MPLQLASHFVAFIDLLGFSEMVRIDCESSHAPKYLEILYDAHLRAATLFSKDLDSGLTQFSDSIVLSRPFDLACLADFISTIAAWQRSLLLDGLLCRGGVTFGKHFVKDRFLFSKGLIDAYRLESTQAKHPRIVISENLLQLAHPTVEIGTLNLIQEEDGISFIDYLAIDNQNEKEKFSAAIQTVMAASPNGDASVQEKMRWLARYADHKLGTNLSGPRFAIL